MTTQQKMIHWAELTEQLIKTIFGEIYAARLVNLTSKLQFTQTAKMYYQLEKRDKSEAAKLGEEAGDPA